MKKLKNAMLFTIGGLALATIAITSCSKSPSSPSGPSLGTSPLSPSTAAVGNTITITGTGFTSPATVTFPTSGSTSATVVSGTTITVVVPVGTTTGTVTVTTAGTTLTAGTLTITYTGPTSDSVATSNLIAHWTFDTDSKETGSTLPASTISGVTFGGTGKIGGAATFTNGYLVYPTISAISVDTALESYSISMWVNIPAGNTGILRSLFQVNPNTYADIWGALSLSLNNNGVGTDTLPLRADQVQIDGRGPTQATTSTNIAGGAGKWTFLTETYDGNGSNQTLKLYADGNLVDSTQFTDVDKLGTQSTFRVVPTGGPSFPGGDAAAANYVSIGTLAFLDRGNTLGNGYTPTTYAPNAADRPWAAGSITGQIDDIRLFNTPLTQAEVTELYTLGSAGK